MDSFRTHYHIIGGTGKGKTTAIEAIQRQLFCHRGRAAHFVLNRMPATTASHLRWFASPYCPQHVRERLVYIDAAREDLVLPFNPLLYTTPAHGYFKVGRACECILRAWASQNIEEMPRLARWTFNAMWAAARLGLTVSDCSHLLMPGSQYHEPILNHLPPLLKAEWTEIQSARSGEASRILESSRNRLKPYIENPILRCMFGSSESKFDVLRFMREGKIVIVNLAPQNRLSPQVADAIGGMIVNEILATARSLPNGECYPTFVDLDEFQQYVGPDIEEAIPEVRQLGIYFKLSHQAFSQLEKGNTDLTTMIWQLQSRIMLGVQGEDADLLAHEIASLKFDPKKIKDEMFTRRQLLQGHEVIRLASWSESESAAENWQKTYAANWSASETKTHSDGKSHADSRGVSRRVNDPLRDFTISNQATDARTAADALSRSNGTGGSEADAKGGSRSHSTSRSVGESLLPIHDEFLEVARRAYYTFEEQRTLWAQHIRQLATGQALVRLVNDPTIYRVDVQKHSPGYLDWEIEKIIRRRPEAIEAVARLIEENSASEFFVSPQVIEREKEARLQRILNPVIQIPAHPGESSATGLRRIEANPMA
jgi:hypothetical protein